MGRMAVFGQRRTDGGRARVGKARNVGNAGIIPVL